MLTLTAGDRQARTLREDDNVRRRAEGRAAWEAPNVRSLAQWLQDVWAESWPSAQLLNSTQMLALWLDAVERDRRGVIGALGCAREALEADRIATLYRLDVDRLPVHSEEHRAWRSWRRRVHQRLREHDWVFAAQLPGRVAAGLRDGSIVAPREIRLAGFGDALTPAEREVLDVLSGLTQVDVVEPPVPQDASATGWRVADADAQFRVIAEEIRERLSACIGNETPPQRIVVVVPDADARRVQFEAALTELVAPWRRREDPAAAPWRWDRGRPLTERALTDAALALLALDARDNEPAAISRMLLAPALWGDRLHAAAALEARLRDMALPRYSLARVVERESDHGGPLRERMQALADFVGSAPARALPSAWSAQFQARLDLFCWPATGDLPSSAFQVLRELQRELSRLAALDTQTGTIDAARARLWLNELLKRRFEPRVESAQPVLIAAPEDALGIDCDLLIVADADAATFPGPARANPFLPIEALRAAGLPQAAPQTWLAQQRDTVCRLLAQSRETIAIAPIVDERGGEVLASPLFDLHWQAAPAPRARSVVETLAETGPHFSAALPDPVPSVVAAENIRGDASLFRLFAESPFFAFCTYRLGIRPLRAYPRGLDASIQGSLLHAALDGLWSRIRDSDGLHALDGDTMRSEIRRVLAPLLAQHLPAGDYGAALVRLEAARLADLLRQWLDHERRRVDAFTVIAQERKLEGSIAGLPLRLRLDRADSVATPLGPRLLIIDYKTGRDADPRGWDADRLREPQLPLYAVLLAQAGIAELPQADGIAFAHLKDGHPALSPRTGWTLRLTEPALRDEADWPEQLQEWARSLAACAQAFLSGRADVVPKLIDTRSPNHGLLDLVGVVVEDEEDDA